MKTTTLLLLITIAFAQAGFSAGLPDAATTAAPAAQAGLQAPKNIAASGYGDITAINGAQTTVSWDSVPGAASYTLYWGSKPSVTKTSPRISATSPYIHGGLDYGQTYYYRVTANNADGESALSSEASTVARVYTTAQRRIVPTAVAVSTPAIRPFDIPEFASRGYGLWSYGPGLSNTKRLDLMPASYAAEAGANAASLLNFFAITDIHITDKESPVEAVYFGLSPRGIISAYSPAMLYTTQVLDAVVRTANALHKENNFDFAISLGDAANSTQYNELRWFIDVLDGKHITPSSGGNAGAKWDYQKPYKAQGLDTAIPWYATLGNHDHFWVGSFPVSDKTRETAVGSTMLNIGNIFTNALGTASTGYYMGAIDGSTQYGTPVGAGPVENFAEPPTVIPDPNRRELTRNEWISEYFRTSSKPKGHGFTRSNAKSGFANYTFKPNPKLPIQVIVLDDTQNDNDPSDGSLGPDWGHGSLDKARYAWLVKELDRGQAEGNLMIIAAHIPIGVSPAGSLEGWSVLSEIKEQELISKLKTYPNLVMWIAGHRHLNTITPMPSPDLTHPERGFWVVETSSLREYPQEFRTFRLVRNNDNTVSVFVTNVDPIIDGSLAAVGRTYAIAAMQIFNAHHAQPENAELVKQLTPEMQTKIQRFGTPFTK